MGVLFLSPTGANPKRMRESGAEAQSSSGVPDGPSIFLGWACLVKSCHRRMSLALFPRPCFAVSDLAPNCEHSKRAESKKLQHHVLSGVQVPLAQAIREHVRQARGPENAENAGGGTCFDVLQIIVLLVETE